MVLLLFRVFRVTGQEVGVEMKSMAYLRCVKAFLYIVATGVGLLACPSSVVVYLSVSNKVVSVQPLTVP